MATTRIAAFNVENMFDRPKAMAESTLKEAAPVLAAHARLNELIQLEEYDDAVKAEILEQLEVLGLLRSDRARFAVLRKIRGRFLTRKRTGETFVVANGRPDWIGWIELTTEPVSALASTHIGMVMRDVAADVLGVVESEQRPLLEAFTESILAEVGWTPYEQVMLFDGNDDRGIDVGLLTRTGHDVTRIRTHIYDTDSAGVIFSRDCAEYHVDAYGHRLVLLVNHLKSKGYGSADDPTGDKRRFRQAARIAAIYNELAARGTTYIAVVGDLNDEPTSNALSPLFERTPLRDVSEIDGFDWGPRKGTYGSGNEGDKIDYVLLSPALFERTTAGGIFRKGVWRGSRTRNKWEIYETMTSPLHAASDHAAIWADIEWD